MINKILIITFSSGLNPGTFMQAYGVQTGLKKIFPNAEVVFLKFPDFKWDKSKKGKHDKVWHVFLQKAFAAYRLTKYRSLEKKIFHFTKRIDLFDYEVNEAKTLLSLYDLIVVGSDTILEQVTGGTKGQYGLNWYSSMLCNKPHILFAASASPAKYATDKDIVGKLASIVGNFRFIGLRDNLTVNFFKDVLEVDSNKIHKQPDPSYLLNIDDFTLNNYYQRKLKGKKIAYYNFMPDFPYRKKLANMLRERGFTVVTSVYNPYADICIDTIGPKEWAGIFKYCTIVVTERFHDSLFALRNGVPVIAVDWENNRISETGDSKTYRILQDYGMEKFHVNLRDESGLKLIMANIDVLLSEFNEETVRNIGKAYTAEANEMLNLVKENILF